MKRGFLAPTGYCWTMFMTWTGSAFNFMAFYLTISDSVVAMPKGDVFNSLLGWLRDEILQVAPSVCAWLPRYAVRSLAHVDLCDGNSDFFSKPAPPSLLEPCVARLQEVKDTSPSQACSELRAALVDLPAFADKCALLDTIGSQRVGPLQYVDDTTVPCSSPGAVRAIVNKGKASACSRYALRTKSEFNYGKNKTCAMAFSDSPPLDAEFLDCQVVDQKVILGVLFDSQLSFRLYCHKHWHGDNRNS